MHVLICGLLITVYLAVIKYLSTEARSASSIRDETPEEHEENYCASKSNSIKECNFYGVIWQNDIFLCVLLLRYQ